MKRCIAYWFLLLIGLVAGCSQKILVKGTETERRFHFTYAVKIDSIPVGARECEIWLPLPQSGPRQDISEIHVASAYPYELTTEPRFHNKILYIRAIPPRQNNLQFEVSFIVRRLAVSTALRGESSTGSYDASNLHQFLQPDSLIPVTGKIKEEARRVTSAQETELQKVRSLYDYIFSSMKYDKSGIGWGRGDALYACDVRRGNCTDFHSLFIGMARSLEIPARFVMGFPISNKTVEGEVNGYHCWAEFFNRQTGWIPVDISEASRFPEKRDFFFGNLDPHRVEFTIGRDIPLIPASHPIRLNYFIDPYVLVDGKEHLRVKRITAFKDISS